MVCWFASDGMGICGMRYLRLWLAQVDNCNEDEVGVKADMDRNGYHHSVMKIMKSFNQWKSGGSKTKYKIRIHIVQYLLVKLWLS